ncbi:hypothetical protein [Nocardia brasiliensis]|nr:hypothetical protein [Nocardia brasiliensis]
MFFRELSGGAADDGPRCRPARQTASGAAGIVVARAVVAAATNG